MRLINAQALKLECFDHIRERPPYAILSHRWEGKEVTLQEFQDEFSATKNMPSHAKINSVCAKSLEEGLRYLWVDTCCIDKTSSAELSEAINSMFKWYEDAAICFTYLSDVGPQVDARKPDASFERSILFKRGWTLQELLTPKEVKFFDSTWGYLGNRESLSFRISGITDVEERYLMPYQSPRQ